MKPDKLFLYSIAISTCIFFSPQAFAEQASSSTNIERRLQIGMSGDDVATVQKLLSSDPGLHFQPSTMGYFGPKTAKAVRYFQTMHGISEKGVIGSETWMYIDKILKGGTSTSTISLTNTVSDDVAKLSAAIKAATSSVPLSVLVEFYTEPSTAEESLILSHKGIIKYTYHLIPVIAAKVPKEDIFDIFNDPHVKTIELDEKLRRMPHDIVFQDTALTSSMPALSQNPRDNLKNLPVSIAVIDTGIDYRHPAIQASYAGGYNFIDNSEDPLDDNGHGTSMAGIILDTIKNLKGTDTVPSNIKIYALKVMDRTGTGFYSDIIAGLQWSVDNHMNIINNSYGTQMVPGNIFEEAFKQTDKLGILSIASAGNSGKCDPTKRNTVEYPAEYLSVVAVSAVNENNLKPCFSSTGPDVEIAAPGVSVKSALIGGGYARKSGTSVAAAYVTGAASIIFSEDGNRSNAKENTRIRSILQQSADDIGTLGQDTLYGFGLINIQKAVKLIAK